MTMAMIYGIVFLIEALIAFQYFEWMFVKPRYTVIKRFVLVLACYVVLFGLFELNILIFNFISFYFISSIQLDNNKIRIWTKNFKLSFSQCGNVSNYDIVRDGGCGGIFWN